MLTFLIIIHVLLCLALIFLVLLQQGKGADLGAVFGNSNSVFGTSSTDNIGKITTALAIVFMITSILLVRTFIFQAKDPDFASKNAVTATSESQGEIQDSVLNKVQAQDSNENNEAVDNNTNTETTDKEAVDKETTNTESETK